MNSMPVAFGPLCVFAAGWVLHVAMWRRCRPRSTIRSLIAIFVAVACLAIAAAVTFGPGWQAMDFAYAISLYAVIVLAYLISYTGLEGQSPSALIVTAAWAAKERGITRADVATLVTEEVFVLSRVNDMTAAGHVVQDGAGRYHLTARGRRFVGLFLVPRKLMNAEALGG